MADFDTPVADADELREAARGLAHATRSVEDTTSIYPVLCSISAALNSLSQSLHQLAASHDGPATKTARMNADPHAGRALSYRASWEEHRAGEMIHQVAETVDRARKIEAAIAPDVRELPLALVPSPTHDGGLSL